MNDSLSLTELNNYFREIIEANFPDELWIIAEISELSENSKGHCYIDFIERNNLNNKIIARQRATVWAFQYRLIKGHFESMTGQVLMRGLKVLVKVRVNYHVLYGLSLNVVDIDPSYTLGEQEKHRLEIINRLEKEGVMNMNKELELSLVPQRLAIISSDTAAGFGDFVNQIEQNSHRYKFNFKLFKANMQGDATSSSVVNALSEIYDCEEEYDAILIIRGGGAKAELAAFDDYDIAYMVSQSPLPVLTGIGHERDESVTDLVAWKKFKTPTAVAVFLLEKFEEYSAFLNTLVGQLQTISGEIIEQNTLHLSNLQYRFKSATTKYTTQHITQLLLHRQAVLNGASRFIHTKENALSKYVKSSHSAVIWQVSRKRMAVDTLHTKTKNACNQFFSSRYHRLAILQEKVLYNNPDQMLKSGYGYVTRDGKRIVKSKELVVGDNIRISFSDGNIYSTVITPPRKSYS